MREFFITGNSSFGNTHQSKFFESTLVYNFQNQIRDRRNSRTMHIEKWLCRRQEP